MYVNPVMLQLPNALTRRGGNVFVVDGAGSRGAGGRGMGSKVYGSIAHWIVSPNRPQDAHKNMTLGLIINGHSTLAGPLANLYLRGDGAIGVVAMGRANHGGVGEWRGITGNQFWIGTEAEGPPFTEAQMDAYPLILAAVYDVTGQHPRDWGISHQEYAPRRKVDIGPAIYAIRNEAVRLVDNKIFAGDELATEEEEEEPMITVISPKDVPSGVQAYPVGVDGNRLWGISDPSAWNEAAKYVTVPYADWVAIVQAYGNPLGVDVVGDGVGNA